MKGHTQNEGESVHSLIEKEIQKRHQGLCMHLASIRCSQTQKMENLLSLRN